MSVDRARELLEEVLQYRDNPQGRLTGTSASQIDQALRELQPHPTDDAWWLETAIARIEDMLMGDDGQAWKEAEKFMEDYNRAHRKELRVIDWQKKARTGEGK